jgi:HNH endonuclease
MGVPIKFDAPHFPYDLEELKHIELLLSKLPIYREKIAELHTEIEAVSKRAANAGAYSNLYEIEDLIYKAFFISLENRPFNSNTSEVISRLKAEVVWEGRIFNRNIPCEVCGENRSIDKCHIIPDKLGGAKVEENLLFLCPTHHRLFDRFMLSKAEWCQIDWARKAESAQAFAEQVTLEAHKSFWAKIDQKKYEKLNIYEVNEKPFVSYVVHKIGELFIPGRLVKRASIYKLLDAQLVEMAKKAIPVLLKSNVLIQVADKSANMLFLPAQEFDVSDDVITEIWKTT